MKVALVHDYLNQYGGAERVLETLSAIYPKAPIYTAFAVPGSPALSRFQNKEIIQSWAAKIPGFKTKLHSPLRFLTPQIWEHFNFDDFDLVISSAAWYITKGILTSPKTLHLCYCHTPPRYLYGYDTSRRQNRWHLKLYASLVNKGLREYDYLSAQRVDHFIANSQEVASRIKKFYGRDSTVIYPPVTLNPSSIIRHPSSNKEYFLTGGRLVHAKHFDLIIKAANQLKLPLKIYGDGPLRGELSALARDNVEFLGRVTDQELTGLYQQAAAFIALSTDEDFGITPVESMAQATPVLAYRGGGYLETVIDGQTGHFVNHLSVKAVVQGIKKIQTTRFHPQDLVKQAQKFSKDRFINQITHLVNQKYQAHLKNLN